MNVAIFEIRGDMAHFRRPDTMGTQATYPFITRTALRGLAASILGRDSLPIEVRCGIRLLAPVRTSTQQMSMHGKSWVSGGDERSFHRLTAIELVVKPHYRIYYTGPHTDELSVRLQSRDSHYHTYLGTAYCLTFPRWVATPPLPEPASVDENTPLTCETVVPSLAVKRLLPREGNEYGRVGGVLWEHIGERKFRGTISLLYDVKGGALQFLPATPMADTPWKFYQIPDQGIVCLW